MKKIAFISILFFVVIFTSKAQTISDSTSTQKDSTFSKRRNTILKCKPMEDFQSPDAYGSYPKSSYKREFFPIKRMTKGQAIANGAALTLIAAVGVKILFVIIKDFQVPASH